VEDEGNEPYPGPKDSAMVASLRRFVPRAIPSSSVLPCGDDGCLLLTLQGENNGVLVPADYVVW